MTCRSWVTGYLRGQPIGTTHSYTSWLIPAGRKLKRTGTRCWPTRRFRKQSNPRGQQAGGKDRPDVHAADGFFAEVVSHFARFDSLVEFDARSLPLGLATFNYDFVINDKVTNSGLEHWQMRKIDGEWKILSVTWTIY